MPQGILDILASDESVVGAVDFVGDNTVDDVLINLPPANGLTLFNGSGQSKFALGDNLLIRKIWCVIPWGFGQGGGAAGSVPHTAGFKFWDGAVLTPIDALGQFTAIPTLCDPVDFGDGLFQAMATAGALREIRLTAASLRVSQIDIPAQLVGDRVAVTYYMEVLHTYPMSV